MLIVDDDEIVREFAGHAMRRAGWTSLVAADGYEALAVWRSHHDEIDVVLTDLNMPGLNGLELARRIRAETNPPPIVVMTGHVDARVGAALRTGEFSSLVAKPFPIETLQATVMAAVVRG